ncbi:hypothetical protein [Bacillus cereus]
MIAWQSAKITIPLKDIITISTNDVPHNKLDHVFYIELYLPRRIEY